MIKNQTSPLFNVKKKCSQHREFMTPLRGKKEGEKQKKQEGKNNNNNSTNFNGQK